MPERPRLHDIVDDSLLIAEIDAGYIRVGRHNTSSYHLLDYTPAAQYDSRWNPATKISRGLLVDRDPRHRDCRIIARPFPKFANHSEHGPDTTFGPLPDPTTPFDVAAKIDGSLAIAHIDADGNVAIATRGSYHSPHAQAATELWQRRYNHIDIDDGTTWLFEYVAPWNRIVVDYGDTEDLIALARIDTTTGADLPIDDRWTGPRAATFDNWTFDDLIARAARTDIDGTTVEGYVLRYHPSRPDQPSLRVKVKHSTYVDLHRTVTNLTPRRVWEWLNDGNDIASLAAVIPDEFHPELRACAERMYQQRDHYIARAQTVLDQLAHLRDGDRRTFAEAVNAATSGQRDITWIVFALHDGDLERTRANLWRKLRPEHDPSDLICKWDPNQTAAADAA